MDSGILIQKLKDARIRRCHMIFDGFCPDQTDRIYLNQIDNHFEYLHPDSVFCLRSFFQAFYSQTHKDTMDRKYFTVNMLSALEKGKFNLYKLFQDPDILELERRLMFLKEKYFCSNDRQDESEFSDNSRIYSAKALDYEEYKSELLPKKSLDVERELFPKSTASSMIKLADLNKNENMESLQEDKLINFHYSQREKQKKLQTYMKRHFGTDNSKLQLQKSMCESRDAENFEKDQLSISLIFKDEPSSDSSSRFLNDNHRKSFPAMHGTILDQLNAEPKGRQNLKKTPTKEVKQKSTSPIKEKTEKSANKSLLKSPNLDTWSNQTTETIRNTETDPLLSLSWRTLRRISLETLANLNSLSLNSMKISQVREIGNSQDLVLSVQALSSHTEKQPVKAVKQFGTTPKKPGMPVHTKSKSTCKGNLALETIKDSIETLNLTKTPQFSKTNEKSKLRNDIFGKTRTGKSASLFDNQPQQSTGGYETQGKISSTSTRRGSKQTKDQQGSDGVSLSKKGISVGNQRMEVKRGVQRKHEEEQKSASKVQKEKANGEGERKSVQWTKPSSSSAMSTPLKKEGSYYVKKVERIGEYSDEKMKNNKENTYNFSFTERELCQSHLY